MSQITHVQSRVTGRAAVPCLRLDTPPPPRWQGVAAASHSSPCLQVVVVLQQVFQLIQKVLSKWLSDAQVVEVSPALSAPGLILAKRIVSSLLPAVVWREQGGKAATLTGTSPDHQCHQVLGQRIVTIGQVTDVCCSVRDLALVPELRFWLRLQSSEKKCWRS